MANIIYDGKIKCQAKIKSGSNCKNLAHWKNAKHEWKYTCGVHKDENATAMVKDPHSKEAISRAIGEHVRTVEVEHFKNVRTHTRPKIILSRLLMMRAPKPIPGYLSVFPNYNDKHRDGAMCLSRLSPKSLGPVPTNCDVLPAAKNIENFHQFAKIWDFELVDGKVPDSIIKARVQAYESYIPHRHKYDSKTLKLHTAGGNINIPLFSVYYDNENNEHRYTYLESRYFYCHWYEILVQKENQYKLLLERIKNGYNIEIFGYDAYPVSEQMKLYNCYMDISRPFGHELVLYTMLTITAKEEYPWNVYYRKNEKIYKNVIDLD